MTATADPARSTSGSPPDAEPDPPGIRGLIRRHPIASFGVLAYGLSWAWWVPIALGHQTIARGRAWPTHFPGLVMPLVAAFAVTAVVSGRDGVRDLASRMGRWRIGWTGWAVALGVPLAMVALSLAVDPHRSWTGLGTFNGLPRSPLLVWPALVFVNGLGEETGWRGFVLPRLRTSHGLVDSSLRVALLWGAWHLPLFAVLAGRPRPDPAVLAAGP